VRCFETAAGFGERTARIAVPHLDLEAAAGELELAGEPGGVVGGEEDRDGGDVAGLSEPAEGGLGDHGFFHVRAEEAGGLGAFGFDEAGVDGVDADFAGAEFLGQDGGDHVERAFGGRIDGGAGGLESDDGRADVDDAAALAEVLDRGLGGEQKAEHVDVELAVKVFLGDRFDGSEFVDAGVVDEDIEAPVVLDGGVDDALGVGGLGDIALDGDGFATGFVNGGDDGFRAFLAGGVVDDDGPSAARALAMPAPMPLDAPVTTATLPVSLLIISFDGGWLR
jgi:hypothetical protein